MVVLHTSELHEVDDCCSALSYPLLSDSHSLEIFTSSVRKEAANHTSVHLK